ncbi:MAG: integrase, partial [Planctomycetota bacterium]
MALARLAGLRSPSELTPLTWDDVNGEKGRLTVRACKTEHHGGDHAVRVVPICPELRAILAEASARAEPGETAIVPLAARKGVNLRTQFERIITKAGHKPW